jgi:hypothetical protein
VMMSARMQGNRRDAGRAPDRIVKCSASFRKV